MVESSVLNTAADPMGAAIMDYHRNGSADVLRVFSSDFEEDEIPVAELFRKYDEMPEIERMALDLAEGDILDVGAGSGCHSLALKSMGKNSLAIDISPLSVQAMVEQGLDARILDFYDEKKKLILGSIDTLISTGFTITMNGGTYVKANVSIEAIDMSSGDDYESQTDAEV